MLNPSGIVENVGDAIMELLPSRAEPSLRLRRSRIARWLIFGLGLILGLALGLSIATIRGRSLGPGLLLRSELRAIDLLLHRALHLLRRERLGGLRIARDVGLAFVDGVD